MGIGTLRNKPCFCKSGKKFKKCCLNIPPVIEQGECKHELNLGTGVCLKCDQQVTDMVANI